MPESTITKTALAGALKTLMRDRPLAKISVGDITDLSGMSRKSFYYHFKDKYELVNWIFETEMLSKIAGRKPESNWDFLLTISEYFYDNRDFYVRAFEVQGQNSFCEYLEGALQPVALEYFNKEFGDSEDHDFYSQYFTDAFRLAIMRWLREDAAHRHTPEQFVRLMRNAVKGVTKLLSNEEMAR